MVGEVDHLDVTAMLTTAKEFLFPKTTYTGLTNYGVPDTTTNIVKTNLMFTTSDVANYGISLSFDFTNPLMGTKLTA